MLTIWTVEIDQEIQIRYLSGNFGGNFWIWASDYTFNFYLFFVFYSLIML